MIEKHGRQFASQSELSRFETKQHNDAVQRLIKAAREVRDGFTYDPGHSDLDNEQPIHVSITLGAWRQINFALHVLED